MLEEGRSELRPRWKTKFRPPWHSPIPAPPGTGSTTGPRSLMRNPVWIGPEAGIRCSADQCSKTWLFLRGHRQSRTLVSPLPRPDPVDKVARHHPHLWRVPLGVISLRHGLHGCKEYVFSPSSPDLAHHPGKCMSQTNSTFTFTTCRILHPSDELTRVTPR